jgi:hypothetical protein
MTPWSNAMSEATKLRLSEHSTGCDRFVEVAARDFPLTSFCRCQKPRGHTGSHYYNERWDWEVQPLVGNKFGLLGTVELHWQNGHYLAGRECYLFEEKKEFTTVAQFMMREKDLPWQPALT